MKAGKAVAALTLAVALAACSDGATDPGDGLDVEAAMTEVASISAWTATELNAGMVAPLHALFRTAVRQVYEAEGAEAARALVEPIHEAARAARELRRTGDVEGFRAAMAEVHGAQAQVIVDVLGTGPVDAALAAAAERIEHMQARLDEAAAAGLDVTVRQEHLDMAKAELAAAQAAYDAGDYAEALLRAHFFGPGPRPGPMGPGGQRRRGG